MIEVDWGDANETILVWAFSSGWTTQDFLDAFKESETLVANKRERTIVHILLDIQHTLHLPKDMFTLGRYAIKRTIENRHKGLIVIINPTDLWLRLYKVLKTTMPNSLDIRFAQNADEAYDMMQMADALRLQ